MSKQWPRSAGVNGEAILSERAYPRSTGSGSATGGDEGLLWGWVCDHATSARPTQDGYARNRSESIRVDVIATGSN